MQSYSSGFIFRRLGQFKICALPLGKTTLG